MEITEVRVKLTGENAERLRAFCSVTFDDEFVVRDLKIIDGTTGPFLAMPSRKLADRCPKCGYKNHLRAKFCNECGARLGEGRANPEETGRSKLHADIAHPINTACRERLQKAIIEAYQAELERSRQPGYKPVEIDVEEGHEHEPERVPEPAPEPTPELSPMSEYDELIQDLRRSAATRGGAAPPAQPHRPPPPPPGQQHRPVPARSGSAPHDRAGGPPAGERRRGDRGDRGDHGDRRFGKPERRPDQAHPQEAHASASPPRAPVIETPRREPERREPPPPPPPAPPPAALPIEQPQPEEDAFGAGLL
jgi:stage V sporulation protein G